MRHREIPDRERFACPHCGERLSTRSSRAISALCKEKKAICSNPDCAASFVVRSEIAHQISPSACPNPAVSLRMAPARRRAANDDGGPEVPPRHANDDTPSEAAG